MRSIITSLLLLSGLAAGAQTNPANQIDWPTGPSGCVYAPGTNTCVPNGSNPGVLHSGVGAPSEGTAATITHISSQVALSGSSSASISGVSVTSGQIIVVTVAGETNYPSVTSLTDTLGTTFTQVSFNGNQATTAFWVGQAIATGSDTITWNPANTINGTISADVYSSNATTYVDAIASAVVNEANPSTTLTNRLSGDLVIGGGAWIWSNGTGLTFTAGSGFTLGSTFPASGVENPTATEYDLSGTSGSQTVAMSQTANTGGEASFGAFSLFAVHTGSVGNDGDWYLDTLAGKLYGPRLDGIYLPTGNNLGAVNVDGTTITEVNGVISAAASGGNVVNITNAVTPTNCTISGSAPYVCATTGAVSSITLASIPGNYLNLRLVINGTNSTSSTKEIEVVLNGDTANHYDYNEVYATATGGPTSYPQTAVAFMRLCAVGASGFGGGGDIFFPGYSGTTFAKWASDSGCGGDESTSTHLSNFYMRGYWYETSAITSIKLTPLSGNFSSGDTFTLYGEN